MKKVFYVQVVDAERLSTPMSETHAFHVEGQKPRMSWSRNCRLFMCEEERGGYLPVLDVLRAICDEKEGLGYKGWISMELFNRSLVKEDPNVPIEHADKGSRINIRSPYGKLESVVVDLPFWDPKKDIPKGNV